jgi:hypothetical protein
MKYIKLFESYNSQKDLEMLTDSILSVILDTSYKNANTIMQLKGIKLKDVNSNGFSEIEPFLKAYSEMLLVIIKPEDVENHDLSEGAVYLVSNDKDGNDPIRYIIISENKHSIEYLNKLSVDGDKEDKDNRPSMLYSLKSDYAGSLLHELQHAYDDWRSKGNALRQSDEYEKKKKISNSKYNKGTENLKEEELQYIGNQYIDYVNLKHEVDARFTVGIKKTDFYFWDIDKMMEVNKDVYTMYSFDEALKNFKRSMPDFRHLSDNEKKRVLHKFGKFYILEEEFVKELNKKQEEYESKN